MEEIWKDIPGFEGMYQASKSGLIKSLSRNGNSHYKKEKILKPYKTGASYKKENCYMSVYLCKDKNKNPKLVHRIVFEAFNGSIIDGFVINHINGIKNDNRIENLESCTQKQNIKHSIDTGLKRMPKNSILLFQTETGIYYESVIQASKACRVSQGYVSRIMRGLSINKTYKSMIKIFYISIFDEGKNFGNAINKAIERLNASDDDWIVLRDLDVAFLTPDAGNLIIEATKSGYDLIGCTMNRLGSNDQTRSDVIFRNMDMSLHYDIAINEQKTYGAKVNPFKKDIAGAFMLFSVKIWRKVKFKNSIVFDREFTKDVRMAGGKVGIMPGLYVFHAYRLWAKTREEARNSVDHLIK